jgi:hypothetical protein
MDVGDPLWVEIETESLNFFGVESEANLFH